MIGDAPGSPGAIPAISLQGLTRVFGDRVAVDSMTLDVVPGELFGFLGPNGAGKTTTIKMLTGLIAPTAGSARLCGFDVVTDSLRAKRVAGYCPDQPVLYERLTGREMLHFAADLYEVPRAMQDARIGPMLETFALRSHAGDLVQSYSRGMRQKLSLCAALIHDPMVLFMDEPTVGLDPASARQLKDVLRHLCAEGRTVFLSTHVLEVAELLCDRVAIVQRGRLMVVDSPSALRTGGNYASLEDAFLGLTGGGNDGGDDIGPLIRALRT